MLSANLKIPSAQLLADIEDEKGNVSKIALKYNVDRKMLALRIEREPELAAALADARAFKPDHDLLLEDIVLLNGNLALLAKKYGVSRNVFSAYCQQHDELVWALYDARETMLDMAEAKLFNRVLAGEAWAVCFFLKTQGRKRGYIERTETFNMNINWDGLSIEQMERLAAGEHPSLVLNQSGTGRHRTRGAAIDADSVAGPGGLSLAPPPDGGTGDE